MMLTVPAAILTELESNDNRPVVVYELELASSTLRYGPQALSWGGNAYSALATKQSPITEQMEYRVPEVAVTFSNVTNTLRAYFEPDDLLTGYPLTVRLLMRNSSGSLLTDSLVLFKGLMDRPKRISETAFEVRVVGILKGWDVAIPRRRTATYCPWVFADGVHCTYSGGTYTDCDRSWTDCGARGQQHHFGGFLASPNMARILYVLNGFEVV